MGKIIQFPGSKEHGEERHLAGVTGETGVEATHDMHVIAYEALMEVRAAKLTPAENVITLPLQAMPERGPDYGQQAS